MDREFTVTAPDGKQFKVRAPEDASDDQLIQLAQAQAPRAPATFGQQVLASAPVRALKGIKDPIDAGAQLLPRGLSAATSVFGAFPNRVSEFFDSEAARVDGGIRDAENEFQAARWATGQEGIDGARLVGNIVSPANLAIASRVPAAVSTLGRVGSGMVGGLLGGLSQPVTDTSETSFAMQKAGQGGVGMLAGGVVTPIAGKVADVLAPKVKALSARLMPSEQFDSLVETEASQAIKRVMAEMEVSDAQMPPALQAQLRQQVVESLKSGRKLDAAALARKLDFEAQGVPYLQPQVTRDPQGYSRALNLRGVEGVGEPISARLQAQNQKITGDIARLGGDRAKETVAAGRGFLDTLKETDDTLNAAVKRAYANARASAGKEWDIPLQGLAQDAQTVIDDFGVGAERNALPSAVATRLKQLGVLQDAGMTQKRVFDYEEADKLLKQINSHLSGDPQNGALKALHGKVKDALLQEGAPGDPFAPARKLAAFRFQLQDAVPALEAASKGQAAPDDFVKKFIVGGKTDDVRRLAELLPPRQLDEARRQVAAYIQQATFQNNAAGDKMASPAGIQKALKTLGTEKLNALFSKPQVEELKRLARITAFANSEPAWGTVARGSNPGGVLFNSLVRGGGPVGQSVTRVLPLLSSVQQGLDARAILSQRIPSAANLTPQEVGLLSKAVGLSGVAAGGLLAPGP
jgi:hypothetical protein